MGASFVASCAVLMIVYATFAVIAFMQLLRISVRDSDPVYSSNWFCPSTVQQQVNVLILLICFFRLIFFFIAMTAWDSSEGEVTSDKVAFYSLDEFATVFFFSLTSILALFWAELYYISTQNAAVFTNVVRPVTYALNVAAILAIAICCYYASTSGSDVDYVFVQFTITIATVYLLSAIMFAYYARAAASELKQIPVMLVARRERLRMLRAVAVVCVVALLVKAALLILFTGATIVTTSVISLVGMFFFYFLLEVFPMAAVLAFYYVEPQEREISAVAGEENGGEPGELTPLDPNSSNVSDSGSAARVWAFTRTTYKPPAASGVDAVIARLSVDA